VHVRLGALDVVVQIIAEELDAVDGGQGLGGVGEVSGEEDWRCERDPVRVRRGGCWNLAMEVYGVGWRLRMRCIGEYSLKVT
jgi:hypothetical protein